MTSLPLNPLQPWMFHIWVDGSFRPPNNASCAHLIFQQSTLNVVELKRHAYRGRTINQMELQAISNALDYPGIKHATIYCDSQYAINCLTIWHRGWEARGWKTPHDEPVKNKDLIQEILEKIKTKKFVKFVKVKAHQAEPYNTLVDFAAAGLSKMMMDNPDMKDGSYPI